MREMGRSRSVRKRRERLGNRMTMIGITFVVMSLAVVMNIRGTTLKEKDLAYQIKEENLTRQLEEERKRSEELEEQRIYVQTKEYIEKVAKEKLGLVNPDEILLKPIQ
ncbi:MAG: septum formation initiator [Hungatella sp.]|nr:septum formation initiator [Hungatella sp.]